MKKAFQLFDDDGSGRLRLVDNVGAGLYVTQPDREGTNPPRTYRMSLSNRSRVLFYNVCVCAECFFFF